MINRIKDILYLLLIILGIIFGLFMGKTLNSNKTSRHQIYSKFEQIQHLKRLHLVSYHFEEIIPVENPNNTNKLNLLLIIPARVNGYINLDKVDFKLINDSLIRVNMPDAEIDSAIFYIDNAISYDIEGLKISITTDIYKQAFDQIKLAIRKSKTELYGRALANGIIDETNQMAKQYIRNMLSELGYVVEFTMK